MPFDSQGNFTRLHSWEQDRIDDIDIVTDHHDEEDDNFAEGLNQCLLRTGTAPMQGNLNLGGFKIIRLGKGTDDADAVNKSQLEESKSDITELLNKIWCIGDIKASVNNTNHGNWFLCNGQAVSRTDYADLFALISTKFGEGDGTTTFNLPDYRGKFLRGLGGYSASDIYTTQKEGLPNILGNISESQQFGVGNGTGCFSTSGQAMFSSSNTPYSSGKTALSFDASRSSSIYGASSHVTPINQAVNYFIKVKEEE